jgi:pyridoxal phosphate enzyme (YggS family)
MSQISGLTDNHKEGNVLIPPSQWGEESMVSADLLRGRLLDIKGKVAPCKPRIIGVTKYFGLSAIVNGYEAGLRDFGESRALDAIKKIEALPLQIRENAKFHFIGHLQTNKVEKVVKNFDYIHSVDSLKVAEAISKVACCLNSKKRVLLQVNIAEEEQKFGYARQQLIEDMSSLLNLDGIDIAGLMCMAPCGAKELELRKLFGGVRELRDYLQDNFKISLPELSMGMSDDYQFAVQEGATMIRIGRKLFN